MADALLTLIGLRRLSDALKFAPAAQEIEVPGTLWEVDIEA